MSSIKSLMFGALALAIAVLGAHDAFAQPTSWGLDRIDQCDLPLDNRYGSTCDGAGISIHVLATGQLDTHVEYLNNRAVSVSANPLPLLLGWGSHWASLAGGVDYGVAPATMLYGYNVVTGFSIDWDKVADALIEVFENAARPALILIPWAVPEAQVPPAVRWMLENMMTGCDSNGIGVVVAAGNDGADACDYWPANIPAALTVAATDNTDTRASWSNVDTPPGTCVDLFAPGQNVPGAWSGSTTDILERSGTGSAAALAAGALAKEWSCNMAPNFDFATAVANLQTAACVNRILDTQGSPNLLLQSR